MIDEMVVRATLDRILIREGGFVDNPADRGGPTKYGITLNTLSEHLGRPASTAEVEALTETEALTIYRKRYISDPGFDSISDPALFDLVVDSAVNHGPSRATKLLQGAVGTKPDGVIGPETLRGLSLTPPAVVRRRVLAARVRLYGRIISADHSQAVFAAGWLNRAAEFIEEA